MQISITIFVDLDIALRITNRIGHISDFLMQSDMTVVILNPNPLPLT